MTQNKVIGIGLGKTGTTSLGKALEVLGYKKHARYNLEALKLWLKKDVQSLLKIVKVYDCLEDYPWLFLYKELYDIYPNAKFILTLRESPEKWFNSLCAHAERSGPTEGQKLIFGEYMPHDFKDDHISFYNKHNQDIIDFFDSNDSSRLLILSIEEQDKWEKICDFLDKEVPRISFPDVNKNPIHSYKAGFIGRSIRRILKR